MQIWGACDVILDSLQLLMLHLACSVVRPNIMVSYPLTCDFLLSFFKLMLLFTRLCRLLVKMRTRGVLGSMLFDWLSSPFAHCWLLMSSVCYFLVSTDYVGLLDTLVVDLTDTRGFLGMLLVFLEDNLLFSLKEQR